MHGTREDGARGSGANDSVRAAISGVRKLGPYRCVLLVTCEGHKEPHPVLSVVCRNGRHHPGVSCLIRGVDGQHEQ